MLEPTRGDNVLNLVLSSQKELEENVKIYEPLGNSDHDEMQNQKVQIKYTGETSTKLNIKI